MEDTQRPLQYWTDVIETSINNGQGVHKDDLENAFAHISEADDRGLFGMCNYYAAYSCIDSDDATKCYPYLNESIRCLLDSPQEVHVARCYNLLGVISHGRNDLLPAAESYYKALEYARKYKDEYMVNLIYSNLADVYYRLHNFEQACAWYEYSLRQFMDVSDNCIHSVENYVEILSSYGVCLSRAGHVEEMKAVFEKLQSVAENNSEIRLSFLTYYVMCGYYYYMVGNAEKLDESLKLMEGTLVQTDGLTRNLDTIWDILELLKICKRYEELNRTLSFLIHFEKDADNPYMMMQLLDYKLRYCSESLSEKQYLQVAAEYFEVKDKCDDSERGSILSLLETQRQLAEIEEAQKKLREQNTILRYRADHDKLSELYNRAKFDTYSRELLNQAIDEGTSYGVLFIDVDHFKQINDRFGHETGDRCIKSVATCIREGAQGEFVARYGGDEFVVVTKGRTPEELLDKAQTIRERVLGRHVEIDGESREGILSVTIGIAHGVARDERQMQSFICMADQALYEQKEACRGGILMHEINSEK